MLISYELPLLISLICVNQQLKQINKADIKSGIKLKQEKNQQKKQFIENKNRMGSYRSQPQLTKTTYQMSSLDHSYASSHMCGWRKYMEDSSITVSPFTFKNYSLFAVFDGHGGNFPAYLGPQVALYAQKKFSQELQRNGNLRKGRFQEALKQTFLKMDILLMSEKGGRQLEQLRKEQIEKNNTSEGGLMRRIGCTSIVVLITKQNIYVANAGDCRAVAFTYDRKCIALSRDHKPHDPGEQNRIKNAGGYINAGRVNGCLNLTRAFGDLEYKQNKNLSLEEQVITSCPEITKHQKKGIQFIILGCDGIWECKNSEEMTFWVQEKLRRREKLGKILEDLLDEIVAKDVQGPTGTDNMSAILVKFDKNQQSNS